MAPVEQLVRRLSEVQDLLSDLPNDAFAERAALLAERRELQARAEMYAAGADRERSSDDLCNEISSLRIAANRVASDSQEAARIIARIERLNAIVRERESIPQPS
jgi:septal ring factor EnvC (AmiA/AmiB activator)